MEEDRQKEGFAVTGYENGPRELFHVHTFRCRHAGDEPDAAYVEKAIRLGADKITFTDHAPFPGDPFDCRMGMDELPDYFASLTALRERYAGRIEIGIGLEIEYLPGFADYYRELIGRADLDFLMIGQHFYQHADGTYSFSDSPTVRAAEEANGVIEAIISGIQTGLFAVVAHPERAFRYAGEWDDAQEALSRRLMRAAAEHRCFLEQNERSKQQSLYRPAFWELLGRVDPSGTVRVLKGLDAHATEELRWP